MPRAHGKVVGEAHSAKTVRAQRNRQVAPKLRQLEAPYFGESVIAHIKIFSIVRNGELRRPVSHEDRRTDLAKPGINGQDAVAEVPGLWRCARAQASPRGARDEFA